MFGVSEEFLKYVLKLICCVTLLSKISSPIIFVVDFESHLTEKEYEVQPASGYLRRSEEFSLSM